MARVIPVFLKPEGQKIVIFGGGPVACRKCSSLEGYSITVVAEKVMPEIRTMASKVIEKRFAPADVKKYVEGAYMAVAATNDKDLNDAIVVESRRAGVPVNSAHGGGNILLPSVVRRDKFSVAVSSEGNAPAFPPYVAQVIDSFLGPEYDRMLTLLTDMRAGLCERVLTQPQRAKYLADILDSSEIWTLLRKGDYRGASEIASRLEEKYH